MTTYSLDPHVVRWMLAQAAPGPWTIHYREDDYQDVVVVRAANDDDVSELPVHEWTYDNSSLIAAAPDLARDYLHARAELDKLKAERDNGETHAYRLTRRPLDPSDPWSESVPRKDHT